MDGLYRITLDLAPAARVDASAPPKADPAPAPRENSNKVG